MTSESSTQTEPQNGSGGPIFAVAGQVIDRLAARDFDAAFRALLPSMMLDLNGGTAVRSTLDTWFGGAERWELVEAVVGEVGGRVHLRWRLRLTNPHLGPGEFLVEQQVYADAAGDGRLREVALLCTGYRPDAP